MSGDHVLWHTGVVDNHAADVGSWKATDEDAAGDTGGNYTSLHGQLGAGLGSDETASLMKSHQGLFDDIGNAHATSLKGIDQQQADQQTGFSRAMARYSG